MPLCLNIFSSSFLPESLSVVILTSYESKRRTQSAERLSNLLITIWDIPAIYTNQCHDNKTCTSKMVAALKPTF